MRWFTQHWCSFSSHRHISSSHFPILIFIRTQGQTKFYAHFSFLLISFQRQLICDYLYLDITMSVSCIWSNEYINHINWLKPIQRQPWLKYLRIQYYLNFRISKRSAAPKTMMIKRTATNSVLLAYYIAKFLFHKK